MPFPVGIRMYLFISVSMPPLPADEICCVVVTIQSYHLTTCGQLGPPLQLETKVSEDFTITEKAPTGALSWFHIEA